MQVLFIRAAGCSKTFVLRIVMDKERARWLATMPVYYAGAG